MALAAIPLLTAIGAAVDYSRANDVQAGLQAALDAAVLAGAKDSSSNASATALAFFNSDFQVQGVSVNAPTFTVNADGSVSGTVSASVPTTFMQLAQVSAMTVTAASKAMNGGYPPCVFALNANAQAAFQLSGNASIQANQCRIQVNSNSTDAVDLTGNASITSAENCFVGGNQTSGNAAISPAPDGHCNGQSDPFAGYAEPVIDSCTYTNYTASGQGTITLNPGVYCGGMKFSGQVNVTFSPGLYIVENGLMQASGGSQFTGDGITFFLTGRGAGVQLSGSANWHLVASNSGALAGFVFFLDPSNSPASSSELSGSSELYFEGLIYLPQQQVTLTGGSSTYTPAPFTMYIADTIRISGNGSLVINANPAQTSVPIPAAALGGQLRLVQ